MIKAFSIEIEEETLFQFFASFLNSYQHGIYFWFLAVLG